MRREVSLTEGMKAAIEGREVLVAVPEEGNGANYRLMPVQEYLRGCWLIVDQESTGRQLPESEKQAPPPSLKNTQTQDGGCGKDPGAL